ncbi:MAG: glycosyl transferase [Gammaproteobacteria bacterium]|jgi:glucosyl-3-phosphoglycerate synthase|nr:glycosyl transferase [Gammaproteobacteria bacterium]MCH1551243.1 glycosyl transferase [Pseudomonadales bacterium]
MSDFFQNGIITTLHNLADRPIEDLEAQLALFARDRPMTLVLPCLYSELAQPALKNILAELSKARYLSHIVIGLDRANKSQYIEALHYFSVLPQRHTVLWNDGPRLGQIQDKLRGLGLAPGELGKGCNVWYCFGYVQAVGEAKAVALHDCDITTYDRGLLARLLYPVAHPRFNYEFCKGFYARVAQGKLNGRVSRLLVSPLIRTMKKVTGQHAYLDYLDSYRYPLAGEFSMQIDVLKDLRIPSDWGLEIGVLSEVFRNYSTNRLCQVEVADRYDHKHQPLSEQDVSSGLSRMSMDISKSMFRKMATFGTVFDMGTVRTIKASYLRVALDLIESYASDAEINGLHLDRDAEERAVEMFASNLLKAGESFLNSGEDTPYIPSWNRVTSVYPCVFNDLQAAVSQDEQEHHPDAISC